MPLLLHEWMRFLICIFVMMSCAPRPLRAHMHQHLCGHCLFFSFFFFFAVTLLCLRAESEHDRGRNLAIQQLSYQLGKGHRCHKWRICLLKDVVSQWRGLEDNPASNYSSNNLFVCLFQSRVSCHLEFVGGFTLVMLNTFLLDFLCLSAVSMS